MQRGLTCGTTIPVPPAAAAPPPPLLRRLSCRSLFPLRAPPRQPPASAALTGRHYALPPCRPPASPSSLRPLPPSPPRRRRRRHRRRRLLLRAPLVFIESKQASWRRPPSPSQPSSRTAAAAPTSRPPIGRRRRARPLVVRRGGSLRTPLAKPRPLAPPALGEGGPARRELLSAPLCGFTLASSPLRPLLHLPPFSASIPPAALFGLGLLTFVSSLRFLPSIPCAFVLPAIA